MIKLKSSICITRPSFESARAKDNNASSPLLVPGRAPCSTPKLSRPNRTTGRRVYRTKPPSSSAPSSFENAAKISPQANGDDKFERLFAALKPSLAEDIPLLTSNSLKLARLEATLSECVKEFDTARPYNEANELMKNPPTNKIEALVGKEAMADKNDTMDRCPASPEQIDESQLEGKMPLDQLLVHLETPSAGSVIRNLEPEDLKAWVKSWTQLAGKLWVFRITFAKFLSVRGVQVKYTCNEDVERHAVQPLGEESPQVSFFDSALGSVELAKRVAMDESLDPLETPTLQTNDPYPNLMTPDPLLDDSRDEMIFGPTPTAPYTKCIISAEPHIHFPRVSHGTIRATDAFSDPDSTWEPETTDETSEDLESVNNLPLPANQTGKGKIHRVQYLVVVGNGDGLVEYGQAKDEDAPRALAKATALAIRSMDTVSRLEKRSITTDMETKLIMRPRPVGFGLRCNPNLHQVLG
ncbi:hypothetical protein JOM56_000492 [Amanita muscaria]